MQRRDRLPAPVRRRFGVEPERVELEQVGLNHLTWIRAVRVDGRRPPARAPGDDGDELADGRPACRSSGSVATGAIPSYYLALLRRRGRRSWPRRRPKPTRAEEVMAIEQRPARALPRSDARHEAGAARAPRRRLLQRGRRPADRVALRRARRHPGRRRPRTTAACRGWPTTTSSRSRPGSTATAPIRSRRRRCSPEQVELVSRVKALRAARRPGGASAATGRSPGRRSRPTRSPAIRTGADELLDAILEANAALAAALLPGWLSARAGRPARRPARR